MLKTNTHPCLFYHLRIYCVHLTGERTKKKPVIAAQPVTFVTKKYNQKIFNSAYNSGQCVLWWP